jgi:preprotein translocase subunit SecD
MEAEMADDIETRLARTYDGLGPGPAARERILAGLPAERRSPGRRTLPVAALVLLAVAAAVAAVVTSLPSREHASPDGPRLVFRAQGDLDATATVMSERLAARGIEDADVRPAEAPGELEVLLPAGAALAETAAMLARPGTFSLRLVAPEGAAPAPGRYWVGCADDGPPLLLEDPDDPRDLFTGADIDPDEVEVHRGANGWLVAFAVRGGRKSDFADFTESNIGRLLAIVIDGKIASAPRTMDRLPGKGMISGGPVGFTREEAESLAAVLRSGPLPSPVEQVHPPREGR